MKRYKGSIALVLLVISWGILFFLTGNKAPWYYFTTENNNDIIIPLGDVPIENYDRMGFTSGLIKYSDLNRAWLVGTERGEVFSFDSNGKQLWKRALGLGKFVSMELSQDGKIVYVGEQSPTGQIFALDTKNGNVVWSYETSSVIGVDVAKRSLPSVVHISVDNEDNIYINAYRFVMFKDGGKGYNARSLAFNKAGNLLWVYPKDEVMDTWINWLDGNGAHDTVVLSSSAYEMRDDMKYKDTLYFINKKTGEKRNSLFIEPMQPFDKTVMRGSPNFSKDGEVLAASCSDGRSYLFDYQGNILWQRTLSEPQLIDGAWLNASGRDGYVIGDKVFFTTINTFNRENWQLPTPVNHPASNSLFAFDKDGKFLYRYKAQGTIEKIDFAGELIACAIGRNVRNHNYGAHGAVVLSARDGGVLAEFETEGPLQSVGISSDGKSLAGLEAPALTPEGKIIGAYQLHIWQL
ncbi:MAG TPA: PQQ-binding-like beta-propeller repeat protein [Candidatus Avacidaminococcus intestinavium]|uniref:PQQ-binding-like beta-propeller repeat protein n=1 Tax=Candidatus Avacidaminococcus intestinavium TaxID=2840684 RepID=A0A9D1MNV4_9FIRM|nr:PQQ-binding-like beta-propeller repeat protein [Candidatus Avacidaminococcus intestinavium]